jgi:hypothetical protein
LLVVLLVRPALVATSHGPYDWYDHLWYVWHQSESIRANTAPSFFAHNGGAVFNAHYAFYGGTLYALAGTLGLVLGSAKAAFDAFWVMAFVMAYGGWFWLARIAGLGRWTAHVPGVLFITSPYYLTLVYRTGAWPELIAVSTIPLLLASGLTMLRDDRLRPWPSLAFAITVVLFTGSHAITLVWGSLVLVIVGVMSLTFVPESRRLFTRRGGLRVLGVALPAMLVNAWFLVPAAAYQSMTQVAGMSAKASLQSVDNVVAMRYLFSLDRIASPPRLMVVELPVVTIGWIVVGVAVVGVSRRTAWFRMMLVLLGVTGVLVILMTNMTLILALPSPLPQIQFGYRLESYILLGMSAMSIVVLRLADRGSGARAVWRWAAVPLLALMVGQAFGQTRADPTPAREGGGLGPRAYLTRESSASELDYASRRLPMLDGNGLGALVFPPNAERGDRVSATVVAGPRQRVITNLALMPPLVKLSGARVAGHDTSGRIILDLPDRPNAATITIRAAHPWPVVLGRALSIIGLAGLLANAIAMVFARRRRDRDHRGPAADTALV